MAAKLYTIMSAKVDMNCPNCHKQNRPGLLLCEHCGYQLITLSDLSRYKTNRIDTLTLPDLPLPPQETYEPVFLYPRPGTGFLHESSFVMLDLIDVGKKLRVKTQGHISLGRADEDSHWQPTIDLTAYGAVERGVSRMHADLFFESDQVYVLELGSVNGTRINGTRVQMGVAQQLRDGDQLELGRMRIRVSFSAPNGRSPNY